MAENTSDAAEMFLRGLVSTHDGDQMSEGMDDLAGMFYAYFKSLQKRGFHYSKAFILTRDMHGIWWNARISHEIMHMHGESDEPEEDEPRRRR